ncbi:hypothetical protein BLNAU_4697 [Blattamonas nauphoetae]|uniref:Uncharacterized protein n=1 Tax=Blattamonas nauphoetae TaxID=2049346 RepID=A0ABQ9Y9S0_9EUKA|nr:hypothetical protein BLNAU_4697 [Blattamonas nauphoetae]
MTKQTDILTIREQLFLFVSERIAQAERDHPNISFSDGIAGNIAETSLRWAEMATKDMVAFSNHAHRRKIVPTKPKPRIKKQDQTNRDNDGDGEGKDEEQIPTMELSRDGDDEGMCDGKEDIVREIRIEKELAENGFAWED